jgi:hypothetical protein
VGGTGGGGGVPAVAAPYAARAKLRDRAAEAPAEKFRPVPLSRFCVR